MADSLEIPGIKQTGLENLVRYFLMRENISKAKEYLEKYEELVNPGSSSSVVNYSFLNCLYLAVSRKYEKMDQIIKNNEFSDQQKFYLMGLRFEYQGNLKEAMEQYLLIKDPDLYTISRLKNLATRLNEFNLIEKLDKQQKSKKSYPDLAYALSVAYARNANDM
jgi:hypothetical protein